MRQKPYQWIIDDLTDEIAFWIKIGMDKEYPETFERMKQSLEKAREKQNPQERR